MISINMQGHRSQGSKLYSGRPLGIDVRGKLGLDSKDIDGEIYLICFPDDTVSINSSYFGGLFEKSIIDLGREGFNKKYTFKYASGKELNESLKRNIEEGIEDALKEY